MTPTHAPLSFTTGDVQAASTVLQATATQLQVRGRTLWPDDPPGEALYLHKLAVHPSAQGQGLAHTLLREAARVTALAGRP
jgi:ribosomal protein S18 acetylase RimI-like enzyme